MLKDYYFAEEVTVNMAAADDPSVYQVSASGPILTPTPYCKRGHFS